MEKVPVHSGRCAVKPSGPWTFGMTGGSFPIPWMLGAPSLAVGVGTIKKTLRWRQPRQNTCERIGTHFCGAFVDSLYLPGAKTTASPQGSCLH